MEENPYKSPVEPASSRSKVTIGRRIAVVLMVPCILMAVWFFVSIVLLATLIFTSEVPVGWTVWQFGVYLLNAATWGATAWAIWANRSRAVIAALCADVAAAAIIAGAVSSGHIL
jgi:hypothetical protein